MATPDSVAKAHALVYQFLELNGYTETAATFAKEANAVANIESYVLKSTPEVPLSQMVQEHELNTMTTQIKNTDLHRAHWEKELVEGDGSHPTILESTIKDVHGGNILSVAIHTSGPMKMIATGSGDKSVKFIDASTGEVTPLFRHSQIMENLLFAAFFSPDGLWYASASYDRTLNIYSWNNELGYQLVKKFGPLVGNVEAICFLPDSLTLVAGVRDDNYLHYISLKDFSDTRYNMNSNGDDWVSFTPMWLSVSPNGKYLLVSTDDSNGRVILFGINSSVQLRNFYGAATDMLSSAPRHCWDPSGRYVYIAGGNDCRIRVIEVKTGKVAYQLAGHTAMIRSLAFDETVGLASTGFDRTIRLWRSEDTTMR
ncbi:hypothetical protein NQZ79_g4475 [Umbelopsis isabellina]|nr:hypothetical protein NQZ79_g4475 [Umbelopsis isabellina]